MVVRELNLLSEEVLSQLELMETTMLSWGFVGGTFNAENEIRKVLDNPPTKLIEALSVGEDTDSLITLIIDNLKNRKLLFISGDRSRTRFAETVRLLYLLKQRFSFKDWQTAPNLISGLKFQLRYRKYPNRDQNWDNISESLKKNGVYNPLSVEIIKKLLKDGELKLSSFQVESLCNLISFSMLNKDGGTIIGAGTGSGKTKAFYLPAISYLCESIRNDASFWTRALAIYPRTELLKDQFKEALSEVTKLNNYLTNQGLRPIMVGTYYGDTPYKAADIVDSTYYKWDKNESGYVCPSVSCPECGDQMLWLFEDHKLESENNLRNQYGEFEILTCSNPECGKKIENKNIVLTRKRIELCCPDILFTTTEMLNRKLFSISDQHVFGIGAAKPPKFLLLDEVHIYNGVNGAHVAYLLRRWRNMIRISHRASAVQFVGLSATLTNPKHFFANLVGLNEGAIHYITPSEDSMTEEGIEYNLVVRGDPMSETALLSASVQVAMLLGRMLDPLGSPVSGGAWGAKIFGFTDKLDVINRWYHIEKDAEERKTLSQFRDANKIDPSTKVSQNKLGQIWPSAEQIDTKGLKKPLLVDITSSQAKGVNSEAKLVIATSTLEVGFNDPAVGAVIQHKAPRSLASFLQRKGRAGRVRGMRPWTLVVTSAYGRDRWVYDNPEQFFDPILPELNLPIRNNYVLHIQASFALMDWLAVHLARRGYTNANVWNILSPKNNGKYTNEKKIIYEMLMHVLTGNYQDLSRFIEQALGLDVVSRDQVLWSPPRSIMFDLIPSLLGQLKTDWKQIIQDGQVITEDLPMEDIPLTGYIPRNLFSSLESNDIKINVPTRTVEETISMRQGLFEFAPGNVSKRYANLNHLGSAHWIDLPQGETIHLFHNISIATEHIDNIVVDGKEISVLTPRQITLAEIPKELSDKSTGQLRWSVKFLPNGQEFTEDNEGKEILPKECSLFNNIFKSIQVFSSSQNQWVECTRFAPEVGVVTKYKKGQAQKRRLNFQYKQNAASLGFQVYCDAIAIHYKEIDIKLLKDMEDWDDIVSKIRSTFYLHVMQSDEQIAELLSVFEIEWLWQICVSSVIAICISKQVGIEQAVEIYKSKLKPISMRTLEAIFQVVNTEESEEEQEERNLLDRLVQYIETPSVINRFLDNLQILWTDIAKMDNLWEWLMEKYISTIASAFKGVIGGMLPDVNTDELLVDIADDVIWISEPESGGIGLINSIANSISNSPQRFEELFMNEVEYCQRHEIAEGLSAVIEGINSSILSPVANKVRNAYTLEQQKDALKDLQRGLFDIGITPKRELIISVGSKILNLNSSIDTDKLIYKLNSRWHEEEQRLNCSFDARIFAVACVQLDEIKEDIDKILKTLDTSVTIQEKHRFTLVESMLWTDCVESCPDCLQFYNPYTSITQPSRLIFRHFVEKGFVSVDYTDSNWKEKLKYALTNGKRVRLLFDYNMLEVCRKEVLDLMMDPAEVGFELLYPFIDGCHISPTMCFWEVRIREVTHA